MDLGFDCAAIADAAETKARRRPRLIEMERRSAGVSARSHRERSSRRASFAGPQQMLDRVARIRDAILISHSHLGGRTRLHDLRHA